MKSEIELEKIDKLQEAHDGLKEKLEELQETINKRQEVSDGFKEKLEELQETINKLQEVRDGFKEKLEELQETINKLQEDRDGLKEKLEELQETINSIKEESKNPDESNEKNSDTTAKPKELLGDYTRLKEFLSEKKWKEANKETGILMLEIAEIQGTISKQAKDKKYLDYKSIEQFPVTDLQVIDRLWHSFSDGKFGFSIQKKFWEETKADKGEYCGYSGGYSNKDFCSRVGWQWLGGDISINPLSAYHDEIYSDVVNYRITYNPHREGHLPSIRVAPLIKQDKTWSYGLGIGKKCGGGTFYYWVHNDKNVDPNYEVNFPPILDCLFSKITFDN